MGSRFRTTKSWARVAQKTMNQKDLEAVIEGVRTEFRDQVVRTFRRAGLNWSAACVQIINVSTGRLAGSRPLAQGK